MERHRRGGRLFRHSWIPENTSSPQLTVFQRARSPGSIGRDTLSPNVSITRVNLWGKVEFEITFKSMSQKKKKKDRKAILGNRDKMNMVVKGVGNSLVE
jgi:hypothetical protein